MSKDSDKTELSRKLKRLGITLRLEKPEPSVRFEDLEKLEHSVTVEDKYKPRKHT